MLQENKDDVTRKGCLMLAISKRFNCTCYPCPDSWNVDMLMARDGYGIGWGELMIKDVALKEMANVYLDKNKYESGLKMRKLFGGRHNINLPFVLFLGCASGNYRCNLSRQTEKEMLTVPTNLFEEF